MHSYLVGWNGSGTFPPNIVGEVVLPSDSSNLDLSLFSLCQPSTLESLFVRTRNGSKIGGTELMTEAFFDLTIIGCHAK